MLVLRLGTLLLSCQMDAGAVTEDTVVEMCESGVCAQAECEAEPTHVNCAAQENSSTIEPLEKDKPVPKYRLYSLRACK